MRNIIKALKSQGYKFQIRNLSTEETAEWNSMISQEVMAAIRPTLSTEDNLQWHLMVIEEELNSSTSIL